MKKVVVILCCLVYLPTFVLAGSGCCTFHGGQSSYCADNGKWVCNDGTYSPSCTCTSPKTANTHGEISKKTFVLAGSGCCAFHGGQSYCANNGRWVCNDGTYSPSCTCTSQKTANTHGEISKKYNTNIPIYYAFLTKGMNFPNIPVMAYVCEYLGVIDFWDTLIHFNLIFYCLLICSIIILLVQNFTKKKFNKILNRIIGTLYFSIAILAFCIGIIDELEGYIIFISFIYFFIIGTAFFIVNMKKNFIGKFIYGIVLLLCLCYLIPFLKYRGGIGGVGFQCTSDVVNKQMHELRESQINEVLNEYGISYDELKK